MRTCKKVKSFKSLTTYFRSNQKERGIHQDREAVKNLQEETEAGHHHQEGAGTDPEKGQGLHMIVVGEDMKGEVETILEEAQTDPIMAEETDHQEEEARRVNTIATGEDLVIDMSTRVGGALRHIPDHHQETGTALITQRERKKSIHISKREKLTSTKMVRKYFGTVFSGLQSLRLHLIPNSNPILLYRLQRRQRKPRKEWLSPELSL